MNLRYNTKNSDEGADAVKMNVQAPMQTSRDYSAEAVRVLGTEAIQTKCRCRSEHRRDKKYKCCDKSGIKKEVELQ